MHSEYFAFSPPMAQNETASSARILVVDDDECIRILFRMLLEGDGHDVRIAGSAAEAIDLLHGNSFDLLVTDLDMPEIHGCTLIRYVRRFWPTLPILICSASTYEELPRDIPSAVNGFLTKPMTGGEFSRAVTGLLHC